MLSIGLSLTSAAVLGGSSFDPASLFAASEAGGWYDPSDLSTMWQDTGGTVAVTSDGDSVARIDDKSGNGNNLTQATASKRPVYKTSGGLHWLLFDGTDDVESGSAVSGTESGIVSGLRVVSASTVSPNVVANVVSASDIVVLTASDTETRLGYYNGATYANKVSGSIDTSDRVLLSNVVKGTSALLEVDGVARSGTTTPSTAIAAGLSVGAATDGSLPFGGRLHGLIIRDTEFSTSEQDSVQTWMASKQGRSL